MLIDANEAKRLVDILNASANAGTGNIDEKDITSILAILNNASKVINENQNLDESDIARLKQIALATLRHVLTLSKRQLDPTSEKVAKKLIVSGLLPLTNLPSWIESFIISGIDLLVDHVLYEKDGSFSSVNTSSLELLLPPYLFRIQPETGSGFVRKLCFMDEGMEDGRGNHCDGDGDEKKDGSDPGMETATKLLNPHAAAALSASLHEIHQLQSASTASSPLLTSEHLISLVDTLLGSLNILAAMKEYDSVPPLIYQLCCLTKLKQNASNSPFKKNSMLSYKILSGIAKFLSLLDKGKEQEEIRWTISTSLSHLGRIYRNNPSLPNVMLNLIKGKHPQEKGRVEPLRFKRITPMVLAMGLTMASSIPRMKTTLLEAIKDLVIEEEILRLKRCSSRWVNSTIAMLNCSDRTSDDDGNVLLEELRKYQFDEGHGSDNCLNVQSHMMHCMKSLVFNVKVGTGDMAGGGAHSLNDEFSSLYPMLVSLGFMLVDSVKKDLELTQPSFTGAHVLPPPPSCVSEVTKNSMNTIQQKANFSTAKIGRSLLVHLFLHAGGSNEDEGIVTGSGYSRLASTPPLCQMILSNASEKFCGMAPNAIEHSYLFRDLVSNYGDMQDKRDPKADLESLGAHILEDGFIPMIIDLLANVPGGGMPPIVAIRSIIPVLSRLLKLSAKKARRNRRKRSVLNDHVDHCFLLAKKALFCTDIDRRKVAVDLLIMIIDVGAEYAEDNSALLEEAIGYIRRCMTQHQCEVRLEAYSSLIAIIPKRSDHDVSAENSPADSQHSGRKLDCNISSIVSQVFLNHLERYITVEEEEAVIEARRKRSIVHGTYLSQQVDVENCENENQKIDQEAPLRLNLCILSGRSSKVSNGMQLGGKKSFKKMAKKSDILAEAKNRISEQLSFFLAASIAVIDDSGALQSSEAPVNELYETLLRLRNKMSDCNDVDPFLKWCKEAPNDTHTDYHEYHVKILSTCMLIVSVSDTLMTIPVRSENVDLEIVGKLFRLRTDALWKAAAVVASAKIKIKKKKKGDRKDVDEEMNNDPNQDEITLADSRNENVRKTLEKFKISVEKTIECPAISSDFLAACLRECGILSQTSGAADVLYSSQSEEDLPTNKCGLASNVDFRRFLLKQCRVLLSGTALRMKKGHLFDFILDSNISDEEDWRNEYIRPSFVLAPILFTEYVSLLQNRCNTSLMNTSDTALANLALQGFIVSVQRIISHVGDPQISSKQRLSGLLATSTKTVFGQFPSFRDTWNSCTIPDSLLQKVPESEKALMKSLIPFIMPTVTLDEDLSRTRGGLLSELISQGLDIEAKLFTQLLACISYSLSPPCREIISLSMLECFGIPDKVEKREGTLGLDHENDDDCQKCASIVIDAAILLDGLIEGTVQDSNTLNIPRRNWRNECGFTAITTSTLKNTIKREIPSRDGGDDLRGSVHLLASSFASSIGTTCNFDEMEDSSEPALEFLCTRVVSFVSASSEVVSKDLSVASTSLLASIENGLADAEFISSKIFPHVSNDGILLLQQHLSNLMSAIGKIICATAPSAELFDDNGNFVSTLLKSCKRLYAIFTKMIGYISNYPKAATTPEIKNYLHLLSGSLNQMTMALLLTIQEKKISGTKQIADSKISLQGRIAGQVVFEIERCDNELLKLSAKLKSNGYEDASQYLESKVSANAIRDFRIKKEEIQSNIDGSVKSVGKKRKIKARTKEGGKRAKMKKYKTIESEEDAESQGSIDENSESDTREDSDRDNESCDEENIVGKFIINSASESSSEDEGSEDEI